MTDYEEIKDKLTLEQKKELKTEMINKIGEQVQEA